MLGVKQAMSLSYSMSSKENLDLSARSKIRAWAQVDKQQAGTLPCRRTTLALNLARYLAKQIFSEYRHSWMSLKSTSARFDHKVAGY